MKFRFRNHLLVNFYRLSSSIAMAEAAPNAELLEWAKKDKRRFLHVVYRVGDLDRTIKYNAIIWRKQFCVLRLSGLIICVSLCRFLFPGFILNVSG